MLTKTQNLSHTRGDTLAFKFEFTDAAGAPVDITGWIIYFTCKTSLEDADDDALIAKEIDTHTSPTGGLSSLIIAADELDALAGKTFYDVQIEKTDGTILTPLIGQLFFAKDVTRRTSTP